MNNISKLKFIDLFAGIGGFHYALHQLGCECVFASEIDEAARVTYERNFISISPDIFENGNFNDDIRKISPSEIPDFDILCAGFPCQPFSQAGYKKGFNDGYNSERGNLFFNIVDILQEKKPKAFFLENVRGIVNHDNGRTFKIIREILEDELGYSFNFKVVRATDYGLPQHRPRAFMIGFRDEGLLKSFIFPNNQNLKFNMSDVFGGQCSREIGFTLRVGGAGSNINDRRNWDSYLVDGEVVKIQPVHALRMQGFPQNFQLPNSRTESMKQLGNSVAVDAVKACADALIKHLKVIDSRSNGETNMAIKRNKGEWTELYTFLKLILDRKLSFCNEKLSPIDDEFIIHKVTTLNIREEVLFENGQTIVLKNGRKINKNNVVNNEVISRFKNSILLGKSTFSIGYVEDLFSDLGIQITRGGNSNQKADIILDVSHNNKLIKNEGFGVKSYLGSKPTLLNASGSNTNFVFEVTNFDDNKMRIVNSTNSKNKIKDRLNYIYSKGSHLEFANIEAKTMQYNLDVLDDGLANLIAKMLLQFYKNRTSKFINSLHEVYKSDSEYKDSNIDVKGYEIKLKRFLVAVLLGMFSGKRWDGKFSSNGSIVVKENGSQVAFHIIKINFLEDFLINNIKFDTPSTTRHRFAAIYKEFDGKYYFKLNLQLRF